MLKNKFGMTTRVLLIVLSVLMAVSLAACKKGDSISSDDMNSAIQSAIDAANKAQEEQNKALQSSIAAKEEADAAQKAAEASSIAAQIKAQEEALKKAQEEADAAQKAAEAASKAAAEAAEKAKAEAEKAAKDAADKAASEAAKKAEESLKALEEALKKAQEEAEAAKKAAEEASKRAEEAISKAEETTKAPETTVVPAETTVVPGPSVPMEDKTDVLTAYSKLKTEYTYTKRDMYNADEYAELVLLFDHASVELNNAVTLDAATSIYNTLVVDAAAIRNVEIAAAEVAALINALGDIETEVFTTQAEMIVEAQKAYEALVAEYPDYLEADEDGYATDDTPEVATKLGINVADLEKADAKLEVLESYIEIVFQEDLAEINKYDPRLRFRPDTMLDLDYNGDEDGTEKWDSLIGRAYYTYRVLAVINGGDMAATDLPIDWEYKVDENGDYVIKDGVRQKDTDKPTAWFTAEDFIEVYALPMLDEQFAKFIKNEAVATFNTKLDAAKTAILSAVVTDSKLFNGEVANGFATDIGYLFEDIKFEFALELEKLSFVDGYKATATLDDAKADVWTKVAVEYVDAINAITTEAKAVVPENYVTFKYDTKVAELEETYSQDTHQSATQQAFYAKALAKAAADKDAFLANVSAAPVYTFETLNALELRAAYGADKDTPVDELTELIDEDGIDAAFYAYANQVVIDAIKDNFVVQLSSDSELGDYILALTNDLNDFRSRVNPSADNIVEPNIYTALMGDKISYLEDENYYGGFIYSNTTKFTAMVEIIDKAIADIEAVKAEDYTDKPVALKVPKTVKVNGTDKTFGDKSKEKDLYWINEDSKNFVLAQITDAEGNYDQEDLEAAIYAEIVGKIATDWETADTVTVKANSLPITYTQTADEQACLAAYAIYEAAYNSLHTAIQEIQKSTAGIQKQIDDYKAYKTVKANVASNAALLEEVNALATTYKSKIAAENVLKKTMVDDTFSGKPNVVQTVGVADHFTISNEFANAENYLLNGVEDNMTSHVTTFKSLFGDDNIVQLYNYRNAVIAELKAVFAKYFNTYADDPNTEIEDLVVWESAELGWVYDLNAAKVSEAGAAYEAQAKTLLDACIANINKVKIDSNADVKDYLNSDKKIYAKGGASLQNAKNMVDAYVVKLLGYTVADTEVTKLELNAAVQNLYTAGTTWSVSADESYSNAQSEIFQAYKVYYAGNYLTLDKNTVLTMNAGTKDISAEYVTLTFVDNKNTEDDADDVTVATIKVKKNTTAHSAPAVPSDDNYRITWSYGDWNGSADGTVTTTYTKLYTYTFLNDKNVAIKTVKVTTLDELAELIPAVPAKTVEEGSELTSDDYIGEWSAIGDALVDNKYIVPLYERQYKVTFYKTATPVEGATELEVLDFVMVKNGTSLQDLIDAKQAELLAAWQAANEGSTEKTADDFEDAAIAAYIPAVPVKEGQFTGKWVDSNEDEIDYDDDVTAAVAYVPYHTEYYTLTFVTLDEEGEVAETHHTFYFQMVEVSYSWIKLDDEDVLYTAAPAVPEKENNYVVWNATDMTKVVLPAPKATEVANIVVKADYTEYRTITYINKTTGQEEAKVKFFIEETETEGEEPTKTLKFITNDGITATSQIPADFAWDTALTVDSDFADAIILGTPVTTTS